MTKGVANTSRLYLRPLVEADLDPYAAILADPEVQTWLNDGRPRSRDFASFNIERFANHMKEKGFTRFGVFDKGTSDVLGHCGVMDYEGVMDFGWTLAKKAWGKGIASEAAHGFLGWAYETSLLDFVTAKAFTGNGASIGVMRNLGMVFDHETTFSNPDYPGYKGHHMAHYYITKEMYLSGR